MEDEDVPREPIPPALATTEALKVVKEVFAEEYRKRSAPNRVALAKRLIEQAGDSANDAASRYVMLREAQQLAEGAGDAIVAIQAADTMTSSFAVRDLDIKLPLLSALARNPAGMAQATLITEELIELSGRLLSEADFDRATKTITLAEGLARKTKDLEMVNRVTATKKEIRDLGVEFGSLAPVKAKLAKDPDDAPANATLGKFYCLVAGDWERGVPLLAKGGDVALKKLADADVAATAGGDGNPVAQAKAGDGWWNLAEQRGAGLVGNQVRARAAHWYGLSVSSLEGLDRVRVEKRLTALESGGLAEPDGRAPRKAAAAALLKDIVNRLPQNLRPRPGVEWDSKEATEWVSANYNELAVDETLTITNSLASNGTGGPRITVWFERIGPIEAGNVKYELAFLLSNTDPAQIENLRKLKAGDRIRLRGKVSRLMVGGWSRSRESNAVTEISFKAEIDPGYSLLPVK